MKRMNKNYWRLGWVLFTNGAVCLLLLAGPIRAHLDQQLLYQTMRMPPPSFSYLREFFSDPWGPILLGTLLVGIAAELRRLVVSPIVNIGPYMVWLIVALWQRAKVVGEATPYELFVGKVLLIIPLIAVIAVDVVFYIAAFRRGRAEGGDLSLPTRV